MKQKKDNEAVIFSTNSVQLADEIRTKFGISPIGVTGDGRKSPKIYVYNESEAEINELLNGVEVPAKE